MPDMEQPEEILELATNQQNPDYANSGIAGGLMGAVGTTGEVIPVPKKKELGWERGITYSYPFSTQYHGYWEVWKTDKVTIKQLENMRRIDGHARALYRLLTLPIRAALKTSVILPVSGVEGGQDEAAFIDMMLNLPPAAGGMVTPLNQLMAQMLLGVFHGFSAFEMVYWVPNRGPLAGKYTLKKASWRPADTVHFLQNDNGEFAGWRQRGYIHGRYVDVRLPTETALVYVANFEEDPLYGVSFFESAFSHFDKKMKLYYLAHLAAQKGAMGTRIGHMPPNPNKADKEHFTRALNEFGVKQYMAMPIDWDVTSIQEMGHYDYMSMIEHHNHMMSESVLASFFDGPNTGGGATIVNDFSAQDDTLFIQMLETIMDDIASVINNQLIPRFIDWNFGTGNYPTFRWGPFTDEQKDAIRLAFNQMALAPQINMAPQLWQAVQQKWGEDLGMNVDYDSLKEQWAQKNEQQDNLDSLNYQVQVVTAKNELDAAVNPPPPAPLGPNGQPMPAAPAGPPAKKAAAVPAKSTAAPVKKTSAPPVKKVSVESKLNEAHKAAASQHTAVKKATKQNSGNPNPSQGAKQLSPKSPAQKDVDRKKERGRGH